MLHTFYNPEDLDSCLAAWATKHALGEGTQLIPTKVRDSLDITEDALFLNIHDMVNIPVSGLLIIDAKLFKGASGEVLSRHQPCCLSAWQRFHVSQPPMVIALMNVTYDGGTRETAAFYNALLATPWTYDALDSFINAYENPNSRISINCDGRAILRYRQLHGDLK